MQDCASSLCDLHDEQQLEVQLGENGEAEVDEATEFRMQEQKRFKKTSEWLSAVCTADKLLIMGITLRGMVELLATFFKGARRYDPTPWVSLLPFIGSESPAMHVLSDTLGHLRDAEHAVWLPIVGGSRVWTERLYVLASTAKWALIGQLHKRFHVALALRWPWRLGLLLSDTVTDDEKKAIAQELYRCEGTCCLDSFSRWARSHRCLAALLFR